MQVRPFLMFQGKAEEAMTFYTSLFRDSKILEILRYGSGGAATAGSVMRASFQVGDQTILCIDSPVQHAFTFTPAFSLFVDCTSEEDIRGYSDALLEGGTALMPLGNYGFSRQFVWINDRYGVFWQLNLR